MPMSPEEKRVACEQMVDVVRDRKDQIAKIMNALGAKGIRDENLGRFAIAYAVISLAEVAALELLFKQEGEE